MYNNWIINSQSEIHKNMVQFKITFDKLCCTIQKLVREVEELRREELEMEELGARLQQNLERD